MDIPRGQEPGRRVLPRAERRRRDERIQQQDVEEAAAVKVWQAEQQAQGGRVFSLAGTEPLDGQQGLDAAADGLASDRAMVVLDALHRRPVRLGVQNPPPEARLAIAAETRAAAFQKAELVAAPALQSVIAYTMVS